MKFKMKKEFKKIVEYDIGIIFPIVMFSFLFLIVLYTFYFYAFTDKVLIQSNPDFRAFITGIFGGLFISIYVALWYELIKSRKVYWKEI